MYQLTHAKRRDIREANLSYLDEELLHQCAYYPRSSAFGGDSPCEECSFEQPLRRCKWAHILNDTRVGKEVWMRRSKENKPERVDKTEKVAGRLGFKDFKSLLTEAEEWLARKRGGRL